MTDNTVAEIVRLINDATQKRPCANCGRLGFDPTIRAVQR